MQTLLIRHRQVHTRLLGEHVYMIPLVLLMRRPRTGGEGVMAAE